MSFDESINRVLQEAYFSSPYEKATGIKRQVALQTEDDESEFRQTKNRKLQAMHLAVLRAIDDWYEAGEPMGKSGADILIDRYLHHMMSEDGAGLMMGDEVTPDDHNRALLALGHATGVKGEELGAQLKHFNKHNWGPREPDGEPTDVDMKPPMSLTRMSNIGDEAQKKVGKELGTLKAKDAMDIEDDPDALADARERLKQWKSGGEAPGGMDIAPDASTDGPEPEPSVEEMIDFYKNDPGGQRAWIKGGVEFEYADLAKGETIEGISDQYVGWTPEMFQQVLDALN